MSDFCSVHRYGIFDDKSGYCTEWARPGSRGEPCVGQDSPSGLFLRVKRGSRYYSVAVEAMTGPELRQAIAERDPEFVTSVLHHLAGHLRALAVR